VRGEARANGYKKGKSTGKIKIEEWNLTRAVLWMVQIKTRRHAWSGMRCIPLRYTTFHCMTLHSPFRDIVVGRQVDGIILSPQKAVLVEKVEEPSKEQTGL
jgi:hypothetical protein